MSDAFESFLERAEAAEDSDPTVARDERAHAELLAAVGTVDIEP